MLVALEDGTALRGDFILRAVQRFDLTPIPSTLEVTLRADDTLGSRVSEGSLLVAGSSSDRYRVLKIQRAPSEWVQGGSRPADVLEVSAVLDGFSALAWPLARAVVKEGKSLSEVYRSCGAAARIAADIPAGRFTCFAGQFPTGAIAQLLQEEAAAPVWSAKGALSFARLTDLFTGAPVDRMAADNTRIVQSAFLERHQIPWAMSTDPAGAAVLGRRDLARPFVYLPRTPARVLNNMTRCLAVRRTMVGGFAGHIRAGDGIDVAGTRHVVVTAAHSWESGAGGGSSNQVTRLWLGQLLK